MGIENFNIGDIVRVPDVSKLTDYDSNSLLRDGMLGIVRGFNDEEYAVGVELFDFEDGHNLNGMIRGRSGWFFKPEHIEFVGDSEGEPPDDIEGGTVSDLFS